MHHKILHVKNSFVDSSKYQFHIIFIYITRCPNIDNIFFIGEKEFRKLATSHTYIHKHILYNLLDITMEDYKYYLFFLKFFNLYLCYMSHLSFDNPKQLNILNTIKNI